jgi:hypothetical protein
MDYFSSDAFKVSLFLVGFFIVYGIIIYLMRNRIIKYILAQPDEKRLKTYKSFSKIMPLIKILFWIISISLVLQILKLFTSQYDLFFFMISMGIVMYIALFVVFLFSKMVLNATGNGSEKK